MVVKSRAFYHITPLVTPPATFLVLFHATSGTTYAVGIILALENYPPPLLCHINGPPPQVQRRQLQAGKTRHAGSEATR
ncbi:hypothetical protein M404DRAFT_994384 [Pisolithus tinctorius Marx 270]|uniref:Uncharacterized protein n=1 Tax=Pisolithus tinctorius Marx 270 TaxID=870435 RepID=A0A0C3JR42_PISTI|nr:hypothetical protein M404DRAFT_994384 [Pisolithus tinctorius Marx 270]